jgi:hypothetical protein
MMYSNYCDEKVLYRIIVRFIFRIDSFWGTPRGWFPDQTRSSLAVYIRIYFHPAKYIKPQKSGSTTVVIGSLRSSRVSKYNRYL